MNLRLGKQGLNIVLHLKYSDLPSGNGERNRHALPVGTESITLPWCSQMKPAQVGDVGVPVQNGPLDVTELRTRA